MHMESRPDRPREEGSGAGLKSLASVALEAHGRTLGTIVIGSLAERDFSAGPSLLEAPMLLT